MVSLTRRFLFLPIHKRDLPILTDSQNLRNRRRISASTFLTTLHHLLYVLSKSFSFGFGQSAPFGVDFRRRRRLLPHHVGLAVPAPILGGARISGAGIDAADVPVAFERRRRRRFRGAIGVFHRHR